MLVVWTGLIQRHAQLAPVGRHQLRLRVQLTDRKFNRMRPSMARVLGLETRSTQAV